MPLDEPIACPRLQLGHGTFQAVRVPHAVPKDGVGDGRIVGTFQGLMKRSGSESVPRGRAALRAGVLAAVASVHGRGLRADS